MKKSYQLLTLLFSLTAMFASGGAYAQTDAEYEAALAAIEDGATYYISTDVDGIKYYLTTTGDLTNWKEYGGAFVFKKVTGGSYKTYGFQIDGGGTWFSNPESTSESYLTKGHLNATGNNHRNDWEAQVFFLGENGKYAIRACNVSYASSGWNWVGSSFWTVNPGPLAEYSFDVNYIWELEIPDDMFKIYLEFNNLITKYDEQVYDSGEGESMNMGTEFGQHTDFETWQKFYELLQEIYNICGLFDPDDNYAWLGDQDKCPTVDEATAYTAAVDSMYQVILDSEVPYMMPQDGYYRIFAHNRYKSKYDESGFVDKAIAASYSDEHKNRAVYGTVKKELANYLWKLTKSESGDSVMIQNAGMGTYISFSSGNPESKVIMTEDVNDASHVMFDYAGLEYVEPDGIGEERDAFAIRLASSHRGPEVQYFHQNNHSSVSDGSSPWGNYGTDSGTDQELSFWRRTFDFDLSAKDAWTSEWYLEYVPDDEAAEIIENFDSYKNHDVLVEKNNALRAEVLAALTTAKDAIKTKLITSASQMTSPYSQNDFGSRDGGDLSAGVLIDGDKSTYWHSAWTETPQEPHYIQIADMQDMVDDCELYFCERSGAANDRPTDFTFLGSDDPEAEDEAWQEIVSLKIPNYAADAESYVPFFVETPYNHIRVVCTNTDGNYGYRWFWHAAELQISIVRENPNSQFAALGEIAEELDNIYNANAATPDEDITPEMYQALLDAFKAFNSGMVDPTELRNALAAYANVTKSIVEGANPGNWANTDIAKAYDELYAEVKDYDNAGRYNATQNHKYAVMLKAMQKSVMEQANGIKTDMWYRIMVPTEEMYDAYGFSKEGVDKSSLIEEQSNLFGTFVAPAVEISEEVPNPTEEDPDAMTTETHLESIALDDVRESSRLFCMEDDEIEDPSLSMFRFVEFESDKADYTNLLTETKENMFTALDMSTNYTRGAALITSASQLSSNASDKSEGTHIEYLVDGNINTFWHSDYHKEFLEPGYIQVALNEPVSGTIQVDITRRQNSSNGHIIRMYVLGSNDAENWSRVGYLETPFTNQNESVTSRPLDLNGTYSYLRFIITNRYGTDAGGNMEFDPFAEITSADEYNTKWTYFHAAEFQIYSVTPDAELTATGKALQQAYTAANEVVLKDAKAEDITSTIQAYRDYRSDFNAMEGRSILPYGADKVPATYAIQNKATGLFIFVDGTGNQNNVYLRAIPTLYTWKAIGYERNLLSGKNTKGESCNNMHVGETNRRFCTWSTTEPSSSSGLVICEADETYEAPTEFAFYKDIKPGKIYNWCNSVTITPQEAPTDAFVYQCVGRYTIEEGDFLALKATESIPAGEPAFFIYSDTTYYDSESEDAEPIKFAIPGDEKFVIEGDTINGHIGCISNHTLKPYEIYFSGNRAVCIGTTGYYIAGNSTCLDVQTCPDVDPEGDYDFSICLNGEADKADGVENIPAAIEKISQPGNVYSMDGKLLRTGATLNSLKTMGKGMYILNGVKVVVK